MTNNSDEGWGPGVNTTKMIRMVSDAPVGRGVLVCPKCGGALRYEKAAPKRPGGRFFARAVCDTPNCLAFMS